jgi:primary-amine oxidase
MRLTVSLILCLFAVPNGISAYPGPAGPAARPHSLKRLSEYKSSGAGCSSGQEVLVKAPVKNIFQSLTDEEYAHVTAYLHEQKDLNLTAVVNSTS